MKHLFLSSLFFLSVAICLAQTTEITPSDTRPAQVVVMTGIQLQWFESDYKLMTVSVERPLGLYNHLGLVGGYYFPKQNIGNYIYYGTEMRAGQEFGCFYKYFFHGRFSGRKSGLYIGPEIRFGVRNYRYRNIIIDFPAPNAPEYINYRQKTKKLLLRWGMQWQFKHAMLEIAAPFGWESRKLLESNVYTYNSESSFIILPTLQLGFRL